MLIRFFAGAAEAAGQESMEVDTAGLSLEGLVERLAADNPGLGRVLAVSSLLVDGARREQGPLDGATQLDVLPPFAGG